MSDKFSRSNCSPTIEIKITIIDDDVKHFAKVLFIIVINNGTELNNPDEIKLNWLPILSSLIRTFRKFKKYREFNCT